MRRLPLVGLYRCGVWKTGNNAYLKRYSPKIVNTRIVVGDVGKTQK